MIGSISSIDVTNDAGFQFYFNYTLDRKEAQVRISVYYRSFLGLKFSETLKIVLDFMVAEFSLGYYIEIYNMTDYQEHVMYHLDDPRQY